MLLKDALDRSLYGVGSAKTWEELLNEIECGEAEIRWEDGRPLRQVRIALVEVRSPQEELLVEDRQEFSDGRVRCRGIQGLSEKFKYGEEPLAVALRALHEELGIEGNVEIKEVNSDITELQESPSYPGLMTRYLRFFFQARLPETLYQDEYVEVQPTKKTFFRWQPAS